QYISAINASSCTVFAVDVPSGLNSATGIVEQAAVHADITYTVECPKTGFFINDGWNHVGEVLTVPIGLGPYATKVDCSLLVLEKSDVAPLVPPVIRTRNKYDRGHVVALAGSHGYAGAAILSTTSALHAGAGIVHLLHPDDCSVEFIGEPREIIRVGYSFDAIDPIKALIDKATACFAGPGLGTGPKQQALLDTLWPNFQKKVVIDADALHWLATTKGTKFGPLPNAILTPHLGELRRFLPGKEPLSVDLIKKCQQLSRDNQTNLLLKGGPSILFSHGNTPIIVMQGTPGMATAGSGDVLTGILASLLAQGLICDEAMKLGSYIHGRAGELAALEETTHCMIASSITKHLPQVFKELVI
ncbi:MAG: NAD(P)H-hydrate dehydratase, partial [Chlamydiales bacterium]|nr:NAD(P)H-hydrate dehydratase [Chlamydiales bacterium]